MKNPNPTLGATVDRSLESEVERLALENKVSKSAMVRKLLEESLNARATTREASAYERLEKRLDAVENRIRGLLVKDVRLSAQTLFVLAHMLRAHSCCPSDEYRNLQEAARTFATNEVAAIQ